MILRSEGADEVAVTDAALGELLVRSGGGAEEVAQQGVLQLGAELGRRWGAQEGELLVVGRRVQGQAEAEGRGEQREGGVEAQARAVGGLVEALEEALDGEGVDVGDGAPVEADRVGQHLHAQVLGELEVLEARRQAEVGAGGHRWRGDGVSGPA